MGKSVFFFQYIIKLKDEDFTRYAVADVNMSKRRRVGGPSKSYGNTKRRNRETFGELVDSYKNFRTRFWEAVTKRATSSALDLGTCQLRQLSEDSFPSIKPITQFLAANGIGEIY